MLAGSTSEVVQLGALIARTHHERWDGDGYPRGLAGEEIPPEGRIAAVADVFDALTSDRVYRPALPVKSARRDDAGGARPPLRPGRCSTRSSARGQRSKDPARPMPTEPAAGAAAPCRPAPTRRRIQWIAAGARSAWSIAAPSCVGGERLDQGGREHDAELIELGRRLVTLAQMIGSAGVGDASRLREHGADRRRRLDHEHIRARSCSGAGTPTSDRLVAEAGDHPLEHAPDFLVGLADQYLCHVSMIDRARWISGGRMV